jgi:CheY-like chemotaxis protein
VTDKTLGTWLQGFQQLERHRIRDILLVSSLFDFYLFEEEGLLYEQIQSEYQGLQLSHTPEFKRVSSEKEALALIDEGERFDLIITTLHLEDTTPLRLARAIRKRGVRTPIVLLGYDTRELNDLITHQDTSVFSRIFVWEGNFRLLIAIVKNLEDQLNAAEDTSRFGVQCILVVEDSIRYISYFLPLLYSEVMRHSRDLIAEGVNAAHKSLRLRARPKILLSSTWEDAIRCFEKYGEHITGVIADVRFPRDGALDDVAGYRLAELVHERYFDVPVLLQSTDPNGARDASRVNALFIWKRSPSFENDFSATLRDHFAFGDFIFRMPDGREVGRATDLPSLEEQLQKVPDESVAFHAEHNHFSTWLKARTEFDLAERLRPDRPEDFASIGHIRTYLIRQLHDHRSFRQRGLLTEFSRDTFDPETSFARTGAGSVGGKARGLAFFNALLAAYYKPFEGLSIEVPPAIVIGTDIFDRFMRDNGLDSNTLAHLPDEEILRRVLAAQRFSRKTKAALEAFLDVVRHPLAVRSSSLLEDSQFHPFAGVYQTYMIPNHHHDPAVRLRELITAIKRVYASTFYKSARDYLKVTSLRFEDEKMAVIVQQMVGAQHGERFYPEIAGVARSYNFYPVGPQKPEEGIVSIALGLGKMIVEGGASVHFCPKYPDHLQQFFSTRDARMHNQREFYALRMKDPEHAGVPVLHIADERVVTYGLAEAERDNTLNAIASTYSAENDAVYDGVSRPGMRIVTFAPILRNQMIPLAEAIDFLCGLASWGIGTPVEIEFAVNLSAKKLGVLQIRPLPLSLETDDLASAQLPEHELICSSPQVLGHGAIHDLRDIVVVDIDRYDRLKSHEVAAEIARINQRLVDERRPYLLVGPGRWGSLDPLLGIPVKWEQISGARAIVEAGFRDISVDPSQGSHFFQNLTAFQVGYFSVSPRLRDSFVDWKWLAGQKSTGDGAFTRHIRLDTNIVAMMNGHTRRGVILKPGVRTASKSGSNS